jgi:hypothetical protein
MTLQEFLQDKSRIKSFTGFGERAFFRGRNPRIICNNGSNLSVQANEHAYCSPRDNNGPWTEVEVGFPDMIKIPDSWREYAEMAHEDRDWRKEDIFAYIPLTLVEAAIEENEGIDWELTLKGEN